MTRRHAHIVNWQQRALTFAVGDTVYPFTADDVYVSGRVVALFPAIGMADVEFPTGTKRYPVEELQRYEAGVVLPPVTENVPGGAGTVSVSGGPNGARQATQRVAEAFVKKALYWASKDRKYQARQDEIANGTYTCPKCKAAALKAAIYKRAEGRSEHLLGCPGCLFLITKSDILGHPEYVTPKVDPLARLRLSKGHG